MSSRRIEQLAAGLALCLLGSTIRSVPAQNSAQNSAQNFAQTGESPQGSPTGEAQDPERGGLIGRDHGPDRPCFDRGRGRPGWAGPPSGGTTRATTSTLPGGLQLGPPGRWWDDAQFAGELHLRAEQQTRMDGIFARSKADLFARYSALRDEEHQLASLTRGTRIDEAVLFAHIDRVSKARAELEKANAHMLLQLRQELTPDQVTTLDAHRPPPPC